MTILDSQMVVGVDVAKDEIVIYRSDLEKTLNIANKRSTLKQWLKTLPAHSAIALEATNIYHLDTTEMAHEMGHDVYVIDGSRLNKYRDGIGMRAKTDTLDAELLARYLSRESDRLRIWNPPPKAYTQMKSLLRRRAQLVRACVALKQSWKNESLLKEHFNQLLTAIAQFEKMIQKTLKEIAEEGGIDDQVKRCQAIEGVGLLTATAAATAFMRGEFANSDEYVAFLGMDPRVRQSGQKDQKRRLSKRGDSEFRRLFHNSAMAASRSPTWKPYYERYLARGLKGTQALVILARKLARVMFALMKNQTEYKPNSMFGCSPKHRISHMGQVNCSKTPSALAAHQAGQKGFSFACYLSPFIFIGIGIRILGGRIVIIRAAALALIAGLRLGRGDHQPGVRHLPARRLLIMRRTFRPRR